jgi:hypothetical protein
MWWVVGGLLVRWSIVSVMWLLTLLFTPAPVYGVTDYIVCAPATVILIVILSPIWIPAGIIRIVAMFRRQRSASDE